MRMLLLAFLLILASLEVRAETSASRESVEKLMELTQVSKMMVAMQSQMANMFEGMGTEMKLSDAEKPAFEKYMKKLSMLMREEMQWEKFKEPFIDIYMKHFSEREVRGLVEFYSSDIGRSMIEKMPLVMQDSMAISQQVMRRMMPKIQELALEMRTEIQESRKGK